jgi:hypothetical protein
METSSRDHDEPGRLNSESRPAAATESHATTDTEQDEYGAPQTVWRRLKGFYERNFGLFLVFLAEVFASLVCVYLPVVEDSSSSFPHALGL